MNVDPPSGETMCRSGLLILLATSFLVGACQSTDAVVMSNKIAPQVQPVFTWLKAVKRGDHEQLKTVFSQRMRSRFDEEGWDKALKTYQEVFKKDFGDYNLEEFAFEFTGGEKEGKVLVVHNGKRSPGLRVIKEEAGWKVNER